MRPSAGSKKCRETVGSLPGSIAAARTRARMSRLVEPGGPSVPHAGWYRQRVLDTLAQANHDVSSH